MISVAASIAACLPAQTQLPITNYSPTPAPIALPPATPLATKTVALQSPAWLPADLTIPTPAEFMGDKSSAVWSARDLNVDALKDALASQARRAGYTVYEITQSANAIYDLLLVKGQRAFLINLTRGLQATVVTMRRAGMIHLKVSGAVNVEVDLPMRERIDTRAGGELFIGTEIASVQCHQCKYYLSLHIAPFKGAATYASKPAGIFLIDAWVIPGGDPETDDYRYAQDCVIVVKDAASGSFQCGGMVNIRDDFKHVDISGTWQQPE